MIIRELYIKNFGKIREKHFYFQNGIQVISGENEYGKTTVHAFIRAMIFGMERGRGRAAAKDEFTRYEPWDNPTVYAGVMRFSCGGRNFRLDRDFGRFTKRVALVCEDDGEELSVDQGDLTVLLGGLTEGLFDSTVSIGQLRAKPGQELADALENYAANLYETGAGELDLGRAFDRLRDKRRSVERDIREEAKKNREKCDRFRQELSYLEQDMEKLNAEYEEKHKCFLEIKDQRGALNMKQENEERKTSAAGGRNMTVTGAAGVLTGTAGMIWTLILQGTEETAEEVQNFLGPTLLFSGLILLIGVVLLMAGVARWFRESAENRKTISEKRKGLDTETEEKQKKEEMLNRLEWEMKRIRTEWKEKEIRCANLREQCEETEEAEIPNHLIRKRKVLELAEEELREAARDTGDQTLRLLKNRTSEIFCSITSGKYKGVDVDGNLQISVWDGMRKTPLDRLSRGTIEQIYFSVRLAAADLLLEEPVPVLLDDIFAFYDDKRLESALKWLRERGKQVIIFSCHKREEEIVKRVLFT